MTGEGGGCPNYISENQVGEVLWHAGEIFSSVSMAYCYLALN